MTQLKDEIARAAMKYDDENFMKNSTKLLNFSRFHWMTTWSKCIILLLLLPLQATSSLVEQELSIQSVLNVPDPINIFSHMAVYDQDTIFLGGTNYVYRVSTENLGIEKLEKIGPNPSNSIGQDCYNDNSCDKNGNNTNVKVLLINKNKAESIGELIICTSLDNGTCEKRHPTTLAVTFREGPVNVVSVTDSNVAFLAPGPSNNRSSPTHLLYLAASSKSSSLTSSTKKVPLFCTRNITTFGLLSEKSFVDIFFSFFFKYINNYYIQYIYGFSSGIYSYVISNQRSVREGVFKYSTKLHRVCQFDEEFNSYAEAPLICFSNNYIGKRGDKLPTIIQAAYTGKSGRFLANYFGISPEDDVLFGMFGSEVPGNNGEESVLCSFPISDLESSFTFETKKCFNGSRTTGPAHLTNPKPCIQSNVSIGKDYCGEFDFNNPIDVQYGSKAFGIIELNTKASFITVTVTYNGDTVAFVGTQSGELKKIRIQSNSEAIEYETVKLEVGLPILNIAFLDEDKKFLLLLTPKKLIKMKVEICDQYEACDDCLRDPFCGWSFQQNRCFFVDDATKSNISVTSCPTVLFINQTSMLDLPTLQNTGNGSANEEPENFIILTLENLPQLSGQYECVYTGYGTELKTSSERFREDELTCVIPPKENISLYTSISDCLGFHLSVCVNNASVVSTFVKFFLSDLTNSLCLRTAIKCPVHGFWSSFSTFGAWSNCSKSCGGGVKNRKRFRTCINPPPSDGGNPCIGEATDSEDQKCNIEDCLTYSSWTPFEFDNWTECSATCDQGYQFRRRSRICTLSINNNESNVCRGSELESEIRECNTRQCPSGSSWVLIGIASSASIAFIAIISIVIVVCICYHRKIRSMNKLYEHTNASNIERNMYQGMVSYNYPDDVLPYIEIIEYNENRPYYASTEEDDGYLKPEDKTECPYDTIKDVGEDESQNDQMEHLCHTSEVETNIEDENTAEINVDLEEKNDQR